MLFSLHTFSRNTVVVNSSQKAVFVNVTSPYFNLVRQKSIFSPQIILLFKACLEDYVLYVLRSSKTLFSIQDGSMSVESLPSNIGDVFWRHLFVQVAYLQVERQPWLGPSDAELFWTCLSSYK